MNEAYIYEGVRTSVGAHGGSLSSVRPDDLAAVAVKAAVARAGVAGESIDDLILGCTNQCGEDNRNVARMAALLAGLPVSVPGMTVNRLCGSGLQAAACAAQAIKADEGNLFVVGGVESMTRAPYVMLKSGSAWNRTPPEIADTTVGWRFINPKMPAEWTISLGETAERVAERYNVSRADQDAFALQSQQRAAQAIASGMFNDELIGVPIAQRDGTVREVTRDEHPRIDITAAQLAKLKPVFVRDGGTVTAGSASGINDGAAALVIGARNAIAKAPLARIVGTAVIGVEPHYMGIGPVPAVQRLLARTGVKLADIDLIELNEAFAAQALACIRELNLDPERVNIYGGGIALGHPLGCTGAKLLVTLAHALRRRNGRYGLVTMCIGVGQGIAMLIERT